VNQSHTDTQKMNQPGASPYDERLDPEERREDGAHVDDEHDRVPHLARGVSLRSESTTACLTIDASNSERAFTM